MSTSSLDEETASKVIKQVEFYFSDSNLPIDRFLRKAVSETDDGMISLGLVCSFGRMRSHLGCAKEEDIPDDTIKSVAETLKTSSFLKVSEDGKKIGRVTPLSQLDEAIEELDGRTIAVSPLAYDVNSDEVESFFAQFSKVNSVRLPRHVADKRLLSGSALVEFSTKEDAEKILSQTLVFAGTDLELKPKKEYDVERAKQEEEAETFRARKNNSKSEPEPNYPKGLIVAFKLKKISSEGSTENETKKETKKEEEAKNEETEKNETKAEESQKSEEKSTRAVYKDNKDVVMREDLKTVFEKFGAVKFVDFNIGSESGYIRFDEAEQTQKARAAAVLCDEGGLIVKNYIAVLDPVTGDAEKQYWAQLRGGQDKRRDNFNSFKGQRGRGGGGGYRGGGGGRHGNRDGKHSRSRDNDTSGRPNKAQKV